MEIIIACRVKGTIAIKENYCNRVKTLVKSSASVSMVRHERAFLLQGNISKARKNWVWGVV